MGDMEKTIEDLGKVEELIPKDTDNMAWKERKSLTALRLALKGGRENIENGIKKLTEIITVNEENMSKSSTLGGRSRKESQNKSLENILTTGRKSHLGRRQGDSDEKDVVEQVLSSIFYKKLCEECEEGIFHIEGYLAYRGAMYFYNNEYDAALRDFEEAYRLLGDKEDEDEYSDDDEIGTFGVCSKDELIFNILLSYIQVIYICIYI